jgi:aryl carrier-like protein
MIIRGGENISPAAMELTLNKEPRLAALDIQIVAAPDEIAGEVPVAVILGTIDASIEKDIRDTIRKHMGTIYLPDEVVSLEMLGLSDYPRTMAGKIQKTKVAKLVRDYRTSRDQPSSNGIRSQLEKDVKEIWARAVGLQPEQLSLFDPISNFADSITVMRVRDKIKRQTGKTLSLSEMVEAGTLSEQIKLLETQAVTTENPQQKSVLQREGPPGVEDMAHLTEDPDIYEGTKKLIEKTISPYGLTWEDVQDVLPTYDFASVMAETRLFDSWNFKMSLVPNNIQKEVGL